MLNLIQSSSLLGLHCQPSVFGWFLMPTQFITLHYSASLHTSRHLVALCKPFPISVSNLESVLIIYKHLKSSDTHQDWHICTFQSMWSFFTVTSWPSLGCLWYDWLRDMLWKIALRPHTELHWAGGLGIPGVLNNSSLLSHPLPYPWLLKKYTLNTYNCPKSQSPATWMCHTVPLSQRHQCGLAVFQYTH